MCAPDGPALTAGAAAVGEERFAPRRVNVRRDDVDPHRLALALDDQVGRILHRRRRLRQLPAADADIGEQATDPRFVQLPLECRHAPARNPVQDGGAGVLLVADLPGFGHLIDLQVLTFEPRTWLVLSSRPAPPSLRCHSNAPLTGTLCCALSAPHNTHSRLHLAPSDPPAAHSCAPPASASLPPPLLLPPCLSASVSAHLSGLEKVDMVRSKDPLHPEQNRGFAFLEFYNASCAALAKTTLSQPDFK